MASGKGFDQHVINTDVIHHRIHQGSLFSLSSVDLALVTTASLFMLIRVGAESSPHIRFAGSVSAGMVGRVYEAPTTTADGTPVTPINRNRFSSRTANTLFFVGPTITDNGVLLNEYYIPGGSKQHGSGGQGGTFEEWIFAPGDYLAQINNIDAQTQIAGLAADFYEPPEGRPFP